MIRRLFFFLYEACVGIKRSGWMIVVSMATIFISLFVFGCFLIIHLNFSQISAHLNSKLEIRVFLNDSLTKKEIHFFKTRVQSLQGVESVRIVSREEAWSTFRKTYQHLSLGEILDANPLPTSLSVSLDDSVGIQRVAAVIKGFNAFVEDVVYGGVLGEKIQRFSRLLAIFGWVLVSLLSLATLLIVINTIRLTIMNRAEEISIMKLVGATNAFIMGPFLVEGILLGLISAGLSMVVLHVGMQVLAVQLRSFFPFFPYEFSIDSQVLVYTILGAWGCCLCFFGAMVSTRATLKKSV